MPSLVQRVDIEYRTVGLDQATAKLRDNSRALDEVRASATRAASGSQTMEQQLRQALKQQEQLNALLRQSVVSIDDYKAAIVGAGQAANDNSRSMADVAKSWTDAASSAIDLAGKLKLLAVSAYALFPSVRALANSGLSAALAAAGPAAVRAGAMIVSAMSPAISFIGRLAVPVGLVAAGWEALNYVVSVGSGLLEKYGDAQRSLFAADVPGNLAKLTRLQDPIDPAQIRLAQELGGKLAEAKRMLQQFWEVHIDVVPPALKLQQAWVGIVDLLARGVTSLSNMEGPTDSLLKKFGNFPFWKSLNFGWKLPGSVNLDFSKPQVDPNANSRAMEIARENLAGALGGQSNFASRYNNALTDLGEMYDSLGKKAKPAADATRDAWDRMIDSIDKHAARLAADTLTVGQSVGMQERLRAEFQLLEAAKQSDKGVTDEQIAAYIRLRATMDAHQAMVAAGINLGQKEMTQFDRGTVSIEKRAQALALARVQNQISFDKQTVGLSNEDVQIARQLRDIYPDVTTALDSSEAAAIRFNNRLREMADLERSAFGALLSSLASAGNLFDALTNSLGGFSSKLAQLQGDKLFDALKSGDFSKFFGNGNLASFGGVAAIGGAGLNAYKSGNAFGGALSGALAGSAFGPAGMAIGALAGLAGGIFGGEAQKKAAEEAHQREVEAAKEAWANMQGEWKKFLGDMTGHNVGSLGETLDQIQRTMKQYYEAAAQAADAKGDYVSEEMQKTLDAANEGTRRAVAEFGLKWSHMLTAFSTGLAGDDPWLQAFDNIRDLAKQAQGFVQDTALSASAGYSQAQEAARTYLLGLLDTRTELTEWQKELRGLKGSAAALTQSLIDLGMGSTEAAQAIDQKLTAAIANLTKKFYEELQSKINEAKGNGYLNQFASLAQEIVGYFTSAMELGTNAMSQIMEYFEAQVKNITESSPEVTKATAKLQEAYNAQANGINQTISTLTQAVSDIADLRASMKLDSGLSTLSPTEQFGYARSQFETLAAKAQVGDVGAIAQLAGASQTYLQQARDYYGSSEAYAAIFSQVDAVLSQTQTSAGQQIGIQQQQLDALNELVGKYIDVGTAVESVATAIDNLNAAQLTAMMAANQALVTAMQNSVKYDVGRQNGGIVPHFAGGGVVGNGIYGIDSVYARYANGGSIMVAGGEGVLTAAATAAIGGETMIDVINRTGRLPSNDNGPDYSAHFANLARVVAAGFNGQTAALVEEVRGLREEVRRQGEASRSERNRPARPGKMHAA